MTDVERAWVVWHDAGFPANRHESVIDVRWMGGEEVAEAIAEEQNDSDPGSFQGDEKITIVEPAEFAGSYCMVLEMVPQFMAYRDESADAA
jgi:hypothetical protein